MNAVDVIKNKIDVEKILKYYNVDYKYYGGFIRCKCPLHNGDNPTAFVINDKGLWSCHTSCGNGDIFTFIEKIEDVNFINSVKILANILDLNIDGMIIAERKSDYQKELEKFNKYISKKKDNTIIEEWKPNTEMLDVKKFRNFPEEILKHFNVKYVKEIEINKKEGGTFKLYNRLLLPIYINNTLIGASLRKTKALDNPKWFHVPPSIKTGSLLYNIDNINKSEEYVIVVEGIFDVFSLYQAGFENVVCTFGAHLTQEQYSLLLRTGKDIVWCYDGDSAGINATKQAIDKMKYKVTQWVMHLPEGADPGNCTSEELIKYFNERERVI